MRPAIVRLETLPDRFSALRAAAEAEGHEFLERVPLRWVNGAYLGDVQASLLGAFSDGELVAIGLQTADEYDPHPDHRRIRHFYVAQPLRRAGLGRALATALIQEALDNAPILHLRATYPASIAFWEAIGFAPVADHPSRTHRMTRA